MKNIMLDLETMGTSSRAAIVQIGACLFDDETGDIEKKFLVNVNLQSSIDAGLQVDEGAIRFWMMQKPEAKTWMDYYPIGSESDINLKFHPRGDLNFALGFFNNFIGCLEKNLPIWSHKTFDIPILASAYKAARAGSLPFKYQDCRDLRTLIALADYKRPDHNGVPHDALSDCEYQVKYLVEAMKKLREKSS